MQHRVSLLTTSIRFRLVTFSVVGFILIGMVAAFARMSYMRSTSTFFEQATQDRQAVFDEILKNKSESLETFASDYSYWDDMVQFVKTKDPAFAELNLVPSLDTYKASALWVYNTKGTQIYTTNNIEVSADEIAPIGLSFQELKQLFSENGPIHHFFAKTQKGLIEIYAAPIQPSSDSERKTPAQGYLLTGRLLDSSFLNTVARSTRANVTVDTSPHSHPGISFSARDGKLAATQQLHDWKGNLLANYVAVFPADNLKRLYDSQGQMAAVILLVYALTCGAYGMVVWLWVLRPLGSIYAALQNKRKDAISDLVTKGDEFGHIARMIAHFFDQQHDLTSEVATLRSVQTNLATQAEELEKINNLMVGRELKMAELKKEIKKLRQHNES